MPAVKATTLHSARPADEVFAALVKVVQDEAHEIAGLSNELREVLFRSKKTTFSWGHTFVSTVVAGDDGGSVLQLTTNGVPGTPRSLMDGRKNKKAGEQLLGSVQTILADPSPPDPRPVASFAVLEDGTQVPWTGGEYPGAN